MKTGLGGIPVAGSVLKTTYDGLDKLISGHAANTLRDHADAEADLARQVLAMGILAQADPEAANEVLAVLEGVEPGRKSEAMDRFMASESDLGYQVAGIAAQIEQGRTLRVGRQLTGGERCAFPWAEGVTGLGGMSWGDGELSPW